MLSYTVHILLSDVYDIKSSFGFLLKIQDFDRLAQFLIPFWDLEMQSLTFSCDMRQLGGSCTFSVLLLIPLSSWPLFLTERLWGGNHIHFGPGSWMTEQILKYRGYISCILSCLLTCPNILLHKVHVIIRIGWNPAYYLKQLYAHFLKWEPYSKMYSCRSLSL